MSTDLLMNITNHSIMIILGKNKETINLQPRQVLLWSDIVISDQTNPNYNEPTINEYIIKGILSKVTVATPNGFTGFASFVLTVV